MRVSRWGNSLAVRLPKTVVDELALKEGDEVILERSGPATLMVSRDRRRADALRRLSELKWTFPEDYKFDREEANARGPDPDEG